MKHVQAWVEPGKSSGIKLVTDGVGWAHRTCVEMEEKMQNAMQKVARLEDDTKGMVHKSLKYNLKNAL